MAPRQIAARSSPFSGPLPAAAARDRCWPAAWRGRGCGLGPAKCGGGTLRGVVQCGTMCCGGWGQQCIPCRGALHGKCCWLGCLLPALHLERGHVARDVTQWQELRRSLFSSATPQPKLKMSCLVTIASLLECKLGPSAGLRATRGSHVTVAMWRSHAAARPEGGTAHMPRAAAEGCGGGTPAHGSSPVPSVLAGQRARGGGLCLRVPRRAVLMITVAKVLNPVDLDLSAQCSHLFNPTIL